MLVTSKTIPQKILGTYRIFDHVYLYLTFGRLWYSFIPLHTLSVTWHLYACATIFLDRSVQSETHDLLHITTLRSRPFVVSRLSLSYSLQGC